MGPRGLPSLLRPSDQRGGPRNVLQNGEGTLQERSIIVGVKLVRFNLLEIQFANLLNCVSLLKFQKKYIPTKNEKVLFMEHTY